MPNDMKDKNTKHENSDTKRIYPVSRQCFNDSEEYRTEISVGEPIELPTFLLPLYRQFEFPDYCGTVYVDIWYVFDKEEDAAACMDEHFDAICEPGDKPYFKLPDVTDEWNVIIPCGESEHATELPKVTDGRNEAIPCGEPKPAFGLT